ncbi:coiled-coil domain-containing protein 7-like [Talpa occidentalis]|uniref:coiled-coil domain-containing protein 7-like n=1 Tax=Talpa occidentalis TaxID=50954 RepID=UPI0023F64895|nr:coiled-coil domain-containing protein 7-like [Talpa occidentalis]
MKPVKHLFASTNKLANVPELKYKRRVPHSPLSPKTKEKHNAKLTHDKTIEPMVLRSPPTVESIIRYALPIPSSKTKELIAEGESIRKITKRLKMVAYNLEKTYGFSAENGEQPAVKAANEELTLSIGDDLNSSLVSTSQFAAELDETVKEEQTLLESVFKWFQQQVNQMEEINKDQDISEAELPASKNALLSISQIIKQVQKLKELKNRLTHRSGTSLEAILSKSMDIENTPDEIQRYEIMQQKIQEFIKTHSAEANVDVREAERPTDYSLNNQFDAMLKIFEKQSDVLEKTVNEQDLLETKYKQMENDFQVLSEEKFSLENELQKLKNSEKTKPTSTQTKKTGKAEKKKDKGNHESSEEKKFLNKDLKSKDFQEMQQAAYELAIQNKFLHEKLKQALQEAERAKNQLSYFLNEGRDLLKSEGKHKATQEWKSIGKIQVEDSEKTPLEEETIEALVTDLGGLKTNDTLQEQQQLQAK